MKKQWRPDGWDEIRKGIADASWMLPNQTEFPIVIPSSFEFDLLKRNLAEAGADAMLNEIMLGIFKQRIKFRRVSDGVQLIHIEKPQNSWHFRVNTEEV